MCSTVLTVRHAVGSAPGGGSGGGGFGKAQFVDRLRGCRIGGIGFEALPGLLVHRGLREKVISGGASGRRIREHAFYRHGRGNVPAVQATPSSY